MVRSVETAPPWRSTRHQDKYSAGLRHSPPHPAPPPPHDIVMRTFHRGPTGQRQNNRAIPQSAQGLAKRCQINFICGGSHRYMLFWFAPNLIQVGCKPL